MKHWRNIVAVAGLLVVLALVVERLLRTGTSSADFWSWADFRSHLIPVGLLEVVIALILLAVLWVGNFSWKEIRRKSRGDVRMEPRDLFAGRWRHVAGLAVLAAILGRAADSLPGIRTPGTLVRHAIFKLDVYSLTGAWVTLVLHFLTAIVVNSVVCFAILWGGYLLLIRRKTTGKNLGVEK
jgi:nitrate reductase gamma subunit